MRNKKINIQSLPIAMEQANEMFNHALQIDKEIQKYLNKDKNNSPLGKMISANVLIGLSIELYLKSLMIAGRKDGVVFGHNLTDLYNEIHPVLKMAIETEYGKCKKSKNVLMVEIGIKSSKGLPPKPEKEPFDGVDFKDFNQSLDTISNIFVESRYYFETIGSSDWSFIKYAFESARCIAIAVKTVLENFRAGIFKGEI
ncbi:hypothetical protein [Marivirga arenosa]|uniref:Uncharacterized protein n=1 Tax=Marivirga arenosa TaxID=3059076 RepID=A0AA51ZW70_9BACT|nr:hypothetical protein [Marivirga sp. BKB1-2]WNB17895.1 hypothetical protein QYS47_28465 [Marivirga sp. BKB1-2]